VAGGTVCGGQTFTERCVMFLLRGTVAELSGQARAGTMVPRLEQRFQEEFGHSPSRAEVRSWDNSIPALLRQLTEAGLDQAEVLLEFRLPGCSKRADALVLGQHPTGGPSCVVVENKQWSSVTDADIGHLLVTVPGMPGTRATELVHPQEQARDYVEYLIYYNCYLGGHPGSVTGCAYLHNARGEDIAAMRQGVPGDLASFPAFAGDEPAAFRAFLRERLAPGPGARIADEVVGSRQAASMLLMQHVPDAIAGVPRFTLLDEQKIAFENVLRTVERAKRAGSKEAVIIRGGPGTGKSAVAIQLLASRARIGGVAHATGSGAFTKTLREEMGGQDRLLKKLFQFTSGFAAAPADSYDVIIVDEAQRIRVRDGQVEHLIRAARVPVFLIDERQWIRSDEIGTVARLKDACARSGASPLEISLDGQFRCGGSDEYIKWLRSLLSVAGQARPWPGDDAFRLRLAESPQQMEAALRRLRHAGHTARIAAGYCWKWTRDPRNGALADDVVIGSWRWPWNAANAMGDIPKSERWATHDGGFGQVGCVYTAQGFEYDYAGVIIGPDLVWRRDRWVCNPAANVDPSMRNATNPETLIRGIYWVLLTRGLRGCVIHSVDPETQQMLASLGIPPPTEALA
jgi:uncharacterized protein